MVNLVESAVETAVPWLGTAKWIALGIAFLSWSGLCLYGGYRWELSTYETAIAKSAEHQLSLEQQYQQIGDELGKAYGDAQTASQARTKLELQALRKPVKGAPAVTCPDVAGVLRRAYAAPNKAGVP